MATLEGISPIVPVSDVSKSVAFYRDVLGFAVRTHTPNGSFALLARDAAGLTLVSASCRFMGGAVKGSDRPARGPRPPAFYARVRHAGISCERPRRLFDLLRRGCRLALRQLRIAAAMINQRRAIPDVMRQNLSHQYQMVSAIMSC